MPATEIAVKLYTIGCYEIEHDDDVENVLADLRANGLVADLVKFRIFGGVMDNAAILVSSSQPASEVLAAVKATDFVTTLNSGDHLVYLACCAADDDDDNGDSDMDNEDD